MSKVWIVFTIIAWWCIMSVIAAIAWSRAANYHKSKHRR